jgi:beta-lactamase regulating signal transducer with metallopeptidase domain
MLDVLARASIGGAIVVVLVWLVNRLLPGLPAATRAFLWWCAAAKFVVSLVWTTPVLLPVLPAIQNLAEDTNALLVAAPTVRTASPEQTTAALETEPAIPWAAILLVLWSAGCCLSVQRGFSRWRHLQRTVRKSSTAPAHLQSMAADLSTTLGLRRVPGVRLSNTIATPLVTGLVEPLILLPAQRLESLSKRQQRMTLCHELVHIRRSDLWLGCLPALAERLFFFHPAAHAAAREYLFWREAACDAAVLRTVDAAPQEYGRLLLDLGVARGGTTLAAAGAPWSLSILKRRIVMLRDPSARSISSRVAAGVFIALAVAAIAPFQLSARAPLASPPLLEAPGFLAPEEQRTKEDERENKLNFVLFFDDDRTTMSGQVPQDINRAKRFKRAGEPLLWFRRDGREFIVRDQAVLQDVIRAWDEVGRIGEEQGKVGEKQGEIGTRQGELGTRQGAIGTEQGKIGTEQGRIGTRQGQLSARESSGNLTEAQREELEKERRALDAKMRSLDDEMRKLDAKMRELDVPMTELSDRMRVLDREMSALSAKMEAAQKRAVSEMRAILERATAAGLAESVR